MKNLLEIAKNLINGIDETSVLGVNLVEDELESGERTISINLRLRCLKTENKAYDGGNFYDGV